MGGYGRTCTKQTKFLIIRRGLIYRQKSFTTLRLRNKKPAASLLCLAMFAM